MANLAPNTDDSTLDAWRFQITQEGNDAETRIAFLETQLILLTARVLALETTT